MWLSWTTSGSWRDPALYEKLALVDDLRDGRTSERKLAEQELKKLLRKKVDG